MDSGRPANRQIIFRHKPMTEETRKQLVKILKEKLEASRMSLRRLRDAVRDSIIENEKEKRLAEDERYRVQRELDEYTHEIQNQLVTIAESKEKEVMTV